MPVHVPEDNKRAASAAAIQSLQRQLIERRQKASTATGATEESEDLATCAVCLCDFEHGELSVLMPCTHPYHEMCLLPWLAKHNSCPSCRYEVMTDDEVYNRLVRVKQDRQRVEKERRAQRLSTATVPAESSALQGGSDMEEEGLIEDEEDDEDEDTMYDDSEVDGDEEELRERRHREEAEPEAGGDDEEEDDDSADDYDDDDDDEDDDEDEEEDALVIDADNDSDVVEITPPHIAAHNRANPIVIDADDDDHKHNELSLDSYPSIPSLPSTATTLSAWSTPSTDSLPLSLPLPLAAPVVSAVSCALCGDLCGGGGGSDVVSTSCCGVVCHSVCVQRLWVGGYVTAAGELTCPSCHAPARLSSTV